MLFGKDIFTSVKNLSEPVFQMPGSVQRSLPIHRISQNGIFELEKKPEGHLRLYDKAYILDDINYSTKDELEKSSLLIQVCKIFNSMNVDFKFCVVNQRRNVEQLKRELLPEETEDPLYRSMIQSYREVLDWRLKEGNSQIEQVKYLVLSCRKPDFVSAKVFFQALEQRISILFHSIGGNLVPLNGIARLKSLHSILRMGHEEEFRVTWKELRRKNGNWKNEICNTMLREKTDHLELEDKMATVLYCRSYPNSLPDGFLNELMNVPFHIDLSVDVVPIPQEVTVRKLENEYTENEGAIAKEQEQKNKRHAFSSEISYPKRRKKEELEKYLDQVHTNDEKLYYMGFLITVFGKDKKELAQNVDTICSTAGGLSLEMEPLYVRQRAGFYTCLPCAAREVDVMRTLFTTALCAFLPYNVQEIMDKEGFFYGINQVSQNPIIINRKKLMNPHAFIFGKTGSGKSMFVKSEIGQVLFLTQDSVIILDPQNEYLDIVKNLGGQEIDFSAKTQIYMNPWEIPDVIPKEFDLDQFIADKSAFTRAVCKEMLLPTELTGIHRTIIDRCVSEWYRGIFHKRKPKSETLVELRELISHQPEPEARELYVALEMFTEGSLNVFAHESNVNISNRLVGLGLKNLGRDLNRIATLVANEIIRATIEYNYTEKVATHVVVDEFQIIIQEELGLETFDNLYRTVRKQGGILTCLTQTLSDSLLKPEIQAMLSNSEFLVLLNQSGIDRNILKNIYPEISEEEIRFVTNARVGTGLLKVGEKVVPFDGEIPKESLIYKLYTTNFYETPEEGGT